MPKYRVKIKSFLLKNSAGSMSAWNPGMKSSSGFPSHGRNMQYFNVIFPQVYRQWFMSCSDLGNSVEALEATRYVGAY